MLLGALFAKADYNYFGGTIVVGLGLVILAVIALPGGVKADERRFLLQLLALALLAKAVGAFVRWYVSFQIYGGLDADGYDDVGKTIGPLIRDFEFERAMASFEIGTAAMGLATGAAYALIGPTLLGGYLLFSFFAFLGSFFFYKAFRTAFPEGNWRLFAVLVFFSPTILYWPTGLAKDALMLFYIGISAYSAALLLTGRVWRSGLPMLALIAAFFIRPHIAGILVLAVAVAFFARRPGSRGSVGITGYVVGGIVVGVAAWLAIRAAASFVGLDSITGSSVLAGLIDRTETIFSETGSGSNFSVVPVASPLWVPMGFVTVLLRPFPWEAHNLQALFQAGEGVLMALLLVWRGRGIVSGLRGIAKEPYLLFVVLVIMALVLVLSTLGNFGLLARQRSVILPFLFMLVAYVPSVVAAKRHFEDEVSS